jgi:acetate kinase
VPDAPAPGSGSEPVLVVNAGSSSLKLRAVPDGPSLNVTRIGEDEPAPVTLDGREVARRPVPDAHAAFALAIETLRGRLDPDAVALVGHRVVHGGERYVAPLPLDAATLADLDALSPLAPLHNPANLAGIRAARDALPKALHVAVFDTAFHARLPRRAYLYALPKRLYREEGIRRYGFHGTSHDVVSERLARRLGRRREELRIVTLHLGNGASATAVDRGRSVDTTMGFTPLEGLVMGTRSGDVDPGVLLHLLRRGETVDGLDDLLNRRAGVLGLSGVSNDLRDVWRAADDGDEDAAAALEVYAYRVRKAIAAMAAAMGGLDALAFTGGVGENDARLRRAATEGLAFLGVALDEAANERHGPRLSAAGASVESWVVPTDEEGRIAELARAAAGATR